MNCRLAAFRLGSRIPRYGQFIWFLFGFYLVFICFLFGSYLDHCWLTSLTKAKQRCFEEDSDKQKARPIWCNLLRPKFGRRNPFSNVFREDVGLNQIEASQFQSVEVRLLMKPNGETDVEWFSKKLLIWNVNRVQLRSLNFGWGTVKIIRIQGRYPSTAVEHFRWSHIRGRTKPPVATEENLKTSSWSSAIAKKRCNLKH